MANRNFNDLSKDAKTRATSMGAVLQGLIDFNRAVDGPGIVEHPVTREMTGCITPAHGAEQISAVTTANPNRFQPISEAGTITKRT